MFQEFFLLGSKGDFSSLAVLELLHANPDSFESFAESAGAVFQPAGKVIAIGADLGECRVVGRAIFPIVFIDREEVVGVEAPAIEFPEGEGSAGAAIAICKRVNVLKAIVEDGGAKDGRELEGVLVPPSQ